MEADRFCVTVRRIGSLSWTSISAHRTRRGSPRSGRFYAAYVAKGFQHRSGINWSEVLERATGLIVARVVPG